jgi:hypothetical protein
MSSAVLQPEAAPLSACTISRDVQNFDLLIEDMEAALGESWGDLGFQDAIAFLDQPDAADLEFVALAVDDHDEQDLTLIGEIISKAKGLGIGVVLIAEEVSPIALHQLLRLGANDFIPYPLPEGELSAAIERLRTPEPTPEPAPLQQSPKRHRTKHQVVANRVQFLQFMVYQAELARRHSPPILHGNWRHLVKRAKKAHLSAFWISIFNSALLRRFLIWSARTQYSRCCLTQKQWTEIFLPKPCRPIMANCGF